jgi:hypothetical protein
MPTQPHSPEPTTAPPLTVPVAADLLARVIVLLEQATHLHHQEVRAARAAERAAQRRQSELRERAQNASRLGNSRAVDARLAELETAEEDAAAASADAGRRYLKAEQLTDGARLTLAAAIIAPVRVGPTGTSRPSDPPAARPDS